ncbi:predicted protein [Postia placenta Mad-698-R]|uniref:DUF6534 domain-containing protein n=1 Tax=Postia placenta MAD-698-R-SB12 TaxID=670580 RepID=A0A1X6N323_9APHY|nr:hypothetical protein POSPLADRAFT_1046364 [Postia placenta MAD-698-R-SB12]EED79617.1 predicted protein [Postia placenta Mad-698-R]OSX63015.1 hypothetical protein POSPLADRAFT_1046364 [Postia placenta MAD-698-R-SB12]
MATSTTTDTLSINLMSSFGPMLIGVLFSCALWGITCVQFYDADSVWLKGFVMIMWYIYCNIGLCCFDIDSVANTYITLGGCGKIGWSWTTIFTHRTWIVSIVDVVGGRKWTGIFALEDQFGLANKSFSELSSAEMIGIQIAVRAVGAAIDITVTICLIYILMQHRHAELIFSNKLIYHLIILAINTGLWTAIVATVDFAMLASNPSSLKYTPFEFSLSSLYINALLANLNARKYLRHGGIAPMNGFIEDGVIAMQPMSTGHTNSFRTEETHDTSVPIKVATSRVVEIPHNQTNPEELSKRYL